MKPNKGFTFAEIMVTIAVLGVIYALVMPSILYGNPNQDKLMMKKAYHIFSDIMYDIINDDGNYPTDYGVCPDNNTGGYIGFDCASSSAKLPYLFSKRVNLLVGKIDSISDLETNSDYTKSSSDECMGIASSCYFLETNDRIIWTFPKANFTKGSYTSSHLIGIDVNGDKEPNCYEGSTSDGCADREKNFDQFRIELFNDGRIKINETDEWAIEAIKAESSLN